MVVMRVLARWRLDSCGLLRVWVWVAKKLVTEERKLCARWVIVVVKVVVC